MMTMTCTVACSLLIIIIISITGAVQPPSVFPFSLLRRGRENAETVSDSVSAVAGRSVVRSVGRRRRLFTRRRLSSSWLRPDPNGRFAIGPGPAAAAEAYGEEIFATNGERTGRGDGGGGGEVHGAKSKLTEYTNFDPKTSAKGGGLGARRGSASGRERVVPSTGPGY